MKRLIGNLKLALFLAFKSIIRGNRWALSLIIVVMALSFANLLLTPSILSGVTDTIDEQQVNTLLANIIIDPEADEYYLDNVSQTQRLVEQIPAVSGVSARLSSHVFMEYRWLDKDSPADKGQSGTWLVSGIDPEQEASVTTISEHIIAGRYLEEGDRDQIVLGIELAGSDGAQTSLFLTLGGVAVGDKVRLTFDNGIRREYTVKGIFKAREMTADRLAFVTRPEMASVMGRAVFSDRASQILVKTIPGADGSQVIAAIKAMGIQGEIRDWRQYAGAVTGIVSSFDLITSLISGIGLVVAAIVMFIVIYINVINRKRQIGILRAIGIKRQVIIFSYVIQALFYGALGVIIGGMLYGYVLQPYFEAYPLDLPIGLLSLAVEPDSVLKATTGLMLAAVFAGFIPVLSIIRQSIIKTIWGT